MVISARRAAVAEGCQERASALSDLEDSQQGHRTALLLTFPTPCPRTPPSPGILAQRSNFIQSSGICEQLSNSLASAPACLVNSIP